VKTLLNRDYDIVLRVHIQNRLSYIILQNGCDRDNVVPLHVIMCTTYSTQILIMWYFYT
jgi:hypothetical protein